MGSPALAATDTRVERRTAWILAWLLCLAFYFLTYALRSAPGVMIPQLSAAFGLATLGISTLVGPNRPGSLKSCGPTQLFSHLASKPTAPFCERFRDSNFAPTEPLSLLPI